VDSGRARLALFLTCPRLAHPLRAPHYLEKIRLEILGLSSSQSQVGSFALVLGETDGNRRLPIIIGGFEAQAIALEIENIKPNRPMTHDLILSITQSFEIGLQEVVISDLREGVFYSKLIMFLDGEIKEIDARPSDAIAVAVRYKAPIYTFETILREAGIVIKDSDSGDLGDSPDESAEETVDDPAVTVEPASNLGKAQMVKKLTQQIEEAIGREDYEKAARLRDEINKLERK
jgi:uncharacterized protein